MVAGPCEAANFEASFGAFVFEFRCFTLLSPTICTVVPELMMGLSLYILNHKCKTRRTVRF